MNIIDLLCERLGLKGKGRYTALAKRFGVPRQHVNQWKLRNTIPRAHLWQAIVLGLELNELLPPPAGLGEIRVTVVTIRMAVA